MAAAATRARIQNAALKLFVTKGIAETTTRDLARRARIAEGTIYRHYTSKDELIQDLFESHFTAFCEALDHAQSEAGPDFDRKLKAMIGYMCRLYDSDPTLYRFLLVIQHDALPRLGARELSPLSVLRDALNEAIRRKEIPVQDVRLTAAMILGAVIQCALALIYGSLEGRMTKFAPSICNACRRIAHAR